MTVNAAKTPQEILKAPYSRVLIPADDGTFTAEILEFPGCVTQGDTPGEAFDNLEEAARLWIEDAIEQELDIPEPSVTEGYAGKIALRLPRSLHRKAVQLAEREGVSLNQFLVTAVAARVGVEDLHKRLLDVIEKRLRPTTSNVFVTVHQAERGQYLDVSEWINLSAALTPGSPTGTTLGPGSTIRNTHRL